MTEIDWAHRESLRMWAVLAARGNPGAQLVASYHGLVPPAILPPAPAPVVRALVPQAPRAVAPAAATPTPVLSGVQRRIDTLASSLLGPRPVAPTDKNLV
jgi:hypothetical protein